MPVAKQTPENYWDDWRAREAKEERHQKEVAERLLKKRKSEDDWGKYFYFKLFNKIYFIKFLFLDLGDDKVNVKLPPITLSIMPTPSVEECFICQSQYRDWLKTKNRGSINRRINLHKLEVHGIPLPSATQPPQPPKKQKNQPC